MKDYAPALIALRKLEREYMEAISDKRYDLAQAAATELIRVSEELLDVAWFLSPR